MASVYSQVLGSIIFVFTWIFIAFHIKWFPIGRTLGTLSGALLLIIFQILSSNDAYSAISLETIALLFGTMLITILLQREGFFHYLIKVLTFRCTTAYSLLIRVCLCSGLLSALVTNDTVCVFLTPVLVELIDLLDLPQGCFLIALATSANIGSTMTPVGNPQNMIIATLSGLSYGQFLAYNALSAIICLILNIIFLAIYYKKDLYGKQVKIPNAKFVRCSEEEMLKILQLEQQHEDEEITGKSSNIYNTKNKQMKFISSPAHIRLEHENEYSVDKHDYSDIESEERKIELDWKQSEDPINTPIITNANGKDVITENYEDSKVIDSNLSVEEIIYNLQIEYSNQQGNNKSSNNNILKEENSHRQSPTHRPGTSDRPLMKNRRLLMQHPVLPSTFQPPLSFKNKGVLSIIKLILHNKLILFLLVLIGTIISFILGANLGWASVCGAAIMLLIDATDPEYSLKQVDWSLLVFFSSLFIVVAGFNATGLPTDAWNAVKSSCNVDYYSGVLLYTIVITIGSNTVSNVPLVLLLGVSIPQLQNAHAAWLILSFVSTIAGNLTLVGSVANLIVCARAKHTYILTFWEYFKFGFPSTIILTWIGVSIMFLLFQ